MAKKKGHQEEILQTQCVAWFRMQHHDKILYAVPNGARRSPQQGARLKASGMLAGVPDLVLAYPCGVYHGLYIEMKSDTGTVSKEQKDIIKRLKLVGYAVAVCYDFDEFVSCVNAYIRGDDAAKILLNVPT